MKLDDEIGLIPYLAVTVIVIIIRHLWTFERDKTVASQVSVSLIGNGETLAKQRIQTVPNSATKMIPS
ncbi:hypothetical protein AOC36_03570 [Erysipelothrix larvae]|uniref:Uncharacterized protein n=1 Tax=Erysipelothrix larvae TaxID=1514105 RepID=A0A0X8GZ41_9FIRM|nr:hypothetical protein AOC36_03570 [Erysipelothrix larvae]